MSEKQSDRANTPRLGFLYPNHAAEDDYPHMARLIQPRIDVEIVHTSIGEDAHREDALRDTGDLKRLVAGAKELATRGVDVAMWACTSGSFVFGLTGAKKQAAATEEFLRVPVSSTSLAFVAALQAMHIERVSIAATYPQHVALLFKQFLAEADISTVQVGSRDILMGVEVGRLGKDDVITLVCENDHSNADAILVPDTALHTVGWINELEAAVKGKVVLTANQVTMWQSLRLLGRGGFQFAPGLGALFTSVSNDSD